jgi:hypothetical protein
MVYTQAWHKSKACNKYISEYKEKRKTHYTWYKGLQEPFKSVWRTILSWSLHGQKINYQRAHVLQLSLHTYTHGDEKDWVLNPRGLSSTYLGIQYLVTRVCDALNLSCEWAWCKCWLQWKGLRTPLEPCLKGATRGERRVLLQAKRQRSLEVVGEEPTQAPREACRRPIQQRLETCPRAWPNSLERVS